MKKIHITESQYKKLIHEKLLNEIQLNGDEALNTTKNLNTAVRDTITNAKNSGVNTDNSGASVSFSADTLRKNGLAEEIEEGCHEACHKGCNEACYEGCDEACHEECKCGMKKFTKKQLKEARAKKMMKEAKLIGTKKEISGKKKN